MPGPSGPATVTSHALYKEALFRCLWRHHRFYTDHTYLATSTLANASVAAMGPSGEAEPYSSA